MIFQISPNLYVMLSFSNTFHFFFFCVHRKVFVHVHCIQVYMCVEIAEHMCTHAWGSWGSFPKNLVFCFMFFTQSFSPVPRDDQGCIKLSGHRSQGICLPHPPKYLDYKLMTFYKGVLD